MSWLNNLIEFTYDNLNLNFPPNNWQVQPITRGAYFFRQTWFDTFQIGNRNFPAFHFFFSIYSNDLHTLYCAGRLELQLIQEYPLPNIPIEVAQLFENVQPSHIAGKWPTQVQDICPLAISLPSNFYPKNSDDILPPGVWDQLEGYLHQDYLKEFFQIQ